MAERAFDLVVIGAEFYFVIGFSLHRRGDVESALFLADCAYQ